MKEISDTPLGKFAVDTDKDKKFVVMYKKHKYPLLDEIRFLEKHGFVNKESVVLDIGAHIGTTVVPLAKIAKKVYTFEPFPESVETLKENIALNNLSNVTIYPIGLGDKTSTASVNITNPHSSATAMLSEGGNIPVERLDDVLPHAGIDFIKIDVEGMEPQVFKGGQRLIAHSQPVIFFEVNLTGLRMHKNSVSELSRFFKDHDYELFLEYEGRLRPLLSLTLTAALLEPRKFFFGIHSGVFNVIAIPRHTRSASLSQKASVTAKMLWDLCKRTFDGREWVLSLLAIAVIIVSAFFYLKAQSNCAETYTTVNGMAVIENHCR